MRGLGANCAGEQSAGEGAFAALPPLGAFPGLIEAFAKGRREKNMPLPRL